MSGAASRPASSASWIPTGEFVTASQRGELPAPNPLLAATVDDGPAVPLATFVQSEGYEHPPYSVDCPNEPHIDADGACICCGGCCCDETGKCSCPSCGGLKTGCNDHDA